jgi:hypothetical protein
MYNAELEPKFPSWFSVNFGSLEGPDTNNNGIRDDVEIYINKDFENVENSKKATLYTFARRLQHTLKNPPEHITSEVFWREREVLWSCLMILGEFKYGVDSKLKYNFFKEDQEFVSRKTLNTLRRDLKKARFMRQFKGHSSSSILGLWPYLHLEEECYFSKEHSDKIRRNHFIKKKKGFGKYGKRFYDSYEQKYGKSKRYLYEDYID